MRDLSWVTAAISVCVAVGVGGLAVVQPWLAVGVVVASGLLLLVATRLEVLTLFLVATVFVESVSLGPNLSIGRIAGAFALVVLALALLTLGTRELRANGLLGAALAYGLWIGVSAYWASDGGYVIDTLLSYALAIAYMLTFAVFVRTSRELTSICAAFAIGAFVFGFSSFAVYAGSGGSVRASGLVEDPNYFAVYQVAALAPALGLAAIGLRGSRQLGTYLVIGAVILSIVASQSRAGLIVLVAGMLAALVLPGRIFFGRARQKVAYVATLVVTAAFIAYAAPASFLARAGTITDALGTNGDRGSGRIDLWRAAWHGFTDHPWFGLGGGNFRAHALDLLQSTPGVDTSQGYVYAGRVVHNIYLETLAELGVVGFSLFMLVLGTTALYLVRSLRRARTAGRPDLARYSIVFLSMLSIYALFGFFLSIELSKLLWIIVGLALSLDVMTRRAVEQGGPTAPSVAGKG